MCHQDNRSNATADVARYAIVSRPRAQPSRSAGLVRYRHVRAVGGGGAGTVSLVEDRLSGELLALKRTQLTGDVLVQASFRREFSTLASVVLPGVPRVHDFGIDADGHAYFTSDFIDGERLDERSGISAEHLLRLVSQVAGVLVPLHRVGLVHGDIKPSNVLVDRVGDAHLIDFGLTLPSEADAFRSVGGTPAFAAPEVLQGGHATRTSDVYSLGATLYFMLAGRPPHAEHGPRMLQARVEGKLCELPSGVSGLTLGAFEIACDALVATVGDRIPSAQEFASRCASLIGEQGDPYRASMISPVTVGREELCSDLERALLGDEDALPLVCLVGEQGSGKSTVLREVRWRLQVLGATVLQLSARRRFPSEVLRTIDGPIVLFVDDFDDAASEFVSAVRQECFGPRARVRALLVAAESVEAAPLLGVGPFHSFPIRPLRVEDVRTLVKSVLGHVDSSVPEAVHARSEGHARSAGCLVQGLVDTGVVTAEGVNNLRLSDLRSPVRALISQLSPKEREVLLGLAQIREPLVREGAPKMRSYAPTLDRLLRFRLLESQVGGRVAVPSPVAFEVIEGSSKAERHDAADLMRSHLELAGLSFSARARLACAVSDREQVAGLWSSAIAELLETGDARELRALAMAMDGLLEKKTRMDLRLRVLNGLNDIGRHRDVLDQAGVWDLAVKGSVSDMFALPLARASVELGRLEQAQQLLQARSMRPGVAVLLAKVYLRLGEYDRLDELAQCSLGSSLLEGSERVSLLNAWGMAAVYRGHRQDARESLQRIASGGVFVAGSDGLLGSCRHRATACR